LEDATVKCYDVSHSIREFSYSKYSEWAASWSSSMDTLNPRLLIKLIQKIIAGVVLSALTVRARLVLGVKLNVEPTAQGFSHVT
jgi:hypothetical protein